MAYKNIQIPPCSKLHLRHDRSAAIDHLRGFVIVLVVLHHAVLAYCRFGHFDRRHYLSSTAPIIDPGRWTGFDVLVLLNDSFFMPLMFLLSGLFVWRSLARKGPRGYLRDRLLRLGMPFAVAVVTIVPLAYFPSFRESGGTTGFISFWATMVFTGPWPSGPPWFVAVLLVLDVTAALWFGFVRQRPFASRVTPNALVCFGLLVAASAATYLPLLALFGANRWVSIGPVSVQASRAGLYGLYFAAGVLTGASGRHRDRALFDGGWYRQWPRWSLLGGFWGTVLVASQVARLADGAALPAWAWLGVYGLALSAFCAAACFALLALFHRFAGGPSAVWDSLAGNAYGIYLLHYPVVTWTQYGLLGVHLDPIAKAGAAFAVALAVSWGGVSLLRRIPDVARVI